MEKIYNSEGKEVMLATFCSLAEGYACPVCGTAPVIRHHCLCCGQPLVTDPQTLENYKEIYTNVDEECRIVDEYLENGGELLVARNLKIETLTETRNRLKQKYKKQ